jgi:anti-sigma regulatory factor (Ser/Thr protein kinase)
MDTRTAHSDLDHDAGAPRAARRFVSSVLSSWGAAADVRERGELLVSELVSNAVLHGLGPIELDLTEVDAGRYRIEVCNGGETRPLMRRAAQNEPSGRGLQLVDQLAGEWGSATGGGQTSVWFELRPARG